MWGLFELLCELSGCMSGLLALCRLFASVENTVEAVEEAVEDAVEKPVEALCEAYLKDPVEKGLEQPFDEVQPMLHEMLHAMLHEMLHCDRKKLEEVLKEVRKEPQHVLMDVAKISLPTAKKLLVKAATAKKPKIEPWLVKIEVSWEAFLQILDEISFDKAHALYLDIVASAGQPDQLCMLLANVAHDFPMQQNQQQPTQQPQQRSHAEGTVPAAGLHLSTHSTNGAHAPSPRLGSGSFPCLACCSPNTEIAMRPNTEIAIF
eukprot:gnl/TRDRNA2_/TRDRNA2_171137_c0_seq8.p1 gnl/TRDRNA2_/TRDRNA2_171137_c0~~gnl/TRDRNA2_/TRDRNA2_171137_c0_seq8.p1  ORF type:complete len:262 (+),score=49.90 gnl/TRDRNA2_/TRDRNA2_171137_c0_seq8:124-909(+)